MYTHSNQRLTIGVPGTPLALNGVAVVGGSTCQIGSRPFDIREISITTATAITVTAVIAQVIWRPDPASATGQVVLGTITVPVSAVVGQVIRKRITPTKVGAGGYLVLNVTQAATAGTGYAQVIGTESSDTPSPGGLVTESA